MKIAFNKPVPPDIQFYQKYLNDIWKSGTFTNDGPLVRKLEQELQKFSGVRYVVLVSSGTAALQIALKAMDVRGEVITTPYSYIASVAAIMWGNGVPVFADINSKNLCIKSKTVSDMVSSRTSAVLPVHIYGLLADIDGFTAVCRKRGLKLLFDAAHCIGQSYAGKSVMAYGDASVASLHATKIFHTIEGGVIFTNDRKIAGRGKEMRNFGMNDSRKISEPGTNAKMSELHAAAGLSLMPQRKKIFARYAALARAYCQYLDFHLISLPDYSTQPNYNFFPIIFKKEAILLKAIVHLRKKGIEARRYFYPTLNKLLYVQKSACPVAEDLASRTLCLPVYYSLKREQVKFIARAINELSRFRQH